MTEAPPPLSGGLLQRRMSGTAVQSRRVSGTAAIQSDDHDVEPLSPGEKEREQEGAKAEGKGRYAISSRKMGEEEEKKKALEKEALEGRLRRHEKRLAVQKETAHEYAVRLREP